MTHNKLLQPQSVIVVVVVEIFKELILQDCQATDEEISDFCLVGLYLTELGVDQETGITSQILLLGMEAANSANDFFEILRTVVEKPVIMQST